MTMIREHTNLYFSLTIHFSHIRALLKFDLDHNIKAIHMLIKWLNM
jgi:hypothetical protein